jgi:DNA-directed RNA polymerase sigma subunit (sigma70/sigma32)
MEILMTQCTRARTAVRNGEVKQAEAFLRKLTRCEEKVLRMRFGIGTRPRRVNEIGRGLGVATTTVRRIQRRAVQRLRLLASNDG